MSCPWNDNCYTNPTYPHYPYHHHDKIDLDPKLCVLPIFVPNEKHCVTFYGILYLYVNRNPYLYDIDPYRDYVICFVYSCVPIANCVRIPYRCRYLDNLKKIYFTYYSLSFQITILTWFSTVIRRGPVSIVSFIMWRSRPGPGSISIIRRNFAVFRRYWHATSTYRMFSRFFHFFIYFPVTYTN